MNFNTNLSKATTIRILSINKNFSPREVKVKHKILAIKYHPHKSSTIHNFSKSAGVEIFKRIVNAH